MPAVNVLDLRAELVPPSVVGTLRVDPPAVEFSPNSARPPSAAKRWP
jgi:hypothetical protein